nr:unnamed protein product [Digitaria exilis]
MARSFLWDLLVRLFLPEDPPQIPQFTGCLTAGAGHISRAPASPPFPPAATPHGLQNPPPLLGTSQGLEKPADSSLPQAPWGPAIPWISGRPVPGTMSGGEEDPEGLA